jgi:Uma2 family endonuclease
MSRPTPAIDSGIVQRTVDQRVMLRDVSWDDFEALLAIRGDSSGVRLAYLEGILELMTPSRDHEILKTKIARLLEAYAEELGIELEGYGSWTIKRREQERGLEPDECYSIGPAGDVPDLAVEVIWTSGGLDKLEIYRRLGIREVWLWREGHIGVFRLRGDEWVRLTHSECLPQVDVALVESCLELPTQTAAVRELRARTRKGAQPGSE